MNVTLEQARIALLKLVNSVPAKSTYADHLAVLSDYFDHQVPLNIENNNLIQRLALAEGFAKRVRELLDVQSSPTPAPDSNVDCTAWLYGGLPCKCTACRVRANG